jgi:hypothetical protein
MTSEIKKDEIKELIKKILDLIYELDEETLREWIYDHWPHAIGLYD